MNIDFVLDYIEINQPLLVELQITNDVKTLFKTIIDLQNTQNIINVNFILDEFKDQQITIYFSTNNFNIIDFPLTIKQIIFDNFYSMDKITYAGLPNFDQTFLDYAKNKNIYLDLTVNDSNCLNFTGSLIYKFRWPFFKNIFTNEK